MGGALCTHTVTHTHTHLVVSLSVLDAAVASAAGCAGLVSVLENRTDLCVCIVFLLVESMCVCVIASELGCISLVGMVSVGL